MTRDRLAIVLPFAVLAGACSSDEPAGFGTQVGVEEELRCEVRDEIVLTDLDAIPDAFSDSPNTILADLPGPFTGALLGEDEVVMGGDATLEFGVPAADLTLVTFDAVDTLDGSAIAQDEMAVPPCPPQLTVDVDVTLAADGYPTFDGTIPIMISPESEGGVTWGLWGRVDPRDDLDATLADPTTFDAATVDRLEARLSVAGHADTRGVELFWLGETDDGGGEDGGASVTHELIFMAQLAR
ncbi:MAG: hypothetical protein AAF211_05980 [Myxococcota bacterium]